MAEKWQYKIELDRFTLKCLINLYSTLAGLSDGYISSLTRNLGYSHEQAQKALLEMDAEAQKKVSDAFQIYQKEKEEGENKNEHNDIR